MRFAEWLKDQTGLSLYDFRVLDDGTSEKQVRDMFNAWVEQIQPNSPWFNEAIETALDYGFYVLID